MLGYGREQNVKKKKNNPALVELTFWWGRQTTGRVRKMHPVLVSDSRKETKKWRVAGGVCTEVVTVIRSPGTVHRG